MYLPKLLTTWARVMNNSFGNHYLAIAAVMSHESIPLWSRYFRVHPDAVETLRSIVSAFARSVKQFAIDGLSLNATTGANFKVVQMATQVLYETLFAMDEIPSPIQASDFEPSHLVALFSRVIDVRIRALPPAERESQIKITMFRVAQLSNLLSGMHGFALEAMRPRIAITFEKRGFQLTWWRCQLPICVAEKDLWICEKCKSVRYCGPAHQKDHWAVHKKSCLKTQW